MMDWEELNNTTLHPTTQSSPSSAQVRTPPQPIQRNTNTKKAKKKMRIINKKSGKVINLQPKQGNDIVYRDKTQQHDSNAWCQVKVLKRTHKNSQNRGPYFHVRYSDGSEGGIYLDETDWHFVDKSVIPAHYADSVHNYIEETDDEEDDDITEVHVVHIPQDKWHEKPVQDAMQKELANFRNFQVYERV